MDSEVVFTFSYKTVKGWRNGIWYVEVYVSAQGETQKIRAGNTPYTTKRKAAAAGDEAVRKLKEDQERRRKQNAILLSRTEEN